MCSFHILALQLQLVALTHRPAIEVTVVAPRNARQKEALIVLRTIAALQIVNTRKTFNLQCLAHGQGLSQLPERRTFIQHKPVDMRTTLQQFAKRRGGQQYNCRLWMLGTDITQGTVRLHDVSKGTMTYDQYLFSRCAHTRAPFKAASDNTAHIGQVSEMPVKTRPQQPQH